MRRNVLVAIFFLLSTSAFAGAGSTDPGGGALLAGCWLCGSAAVVGAHALEKAHGGPADPAPTPTPRVPDSEYVPTGKGPTSFETNDGWHTIEAGQSWRVVTRDGRTFEGNVNGVSTRGLAIAGAPVVLANDIVSLQRL